MCMALSLVAAGLGGCDETGTGPMDAGPVDAGRSPDATVDAGRPSDAGPSGSSLAYVVYGRFDFPDWPTEFVGPAPEAVEFHFSASKAEARVWVSARGHLSARDLRQEAEGLVPDGVLRVPTGAVSDCDALGRHYELTGLVIDPETLAPGPAADVRLTVYYADLEAVVSGRVLLTAVPDDDSPALRAAGTPNHHNPFRSAIALFSEAVRLDAPRLVSDPVAGGERVVVDLVADEVAASAYTPFSGWIPPGHRYRFETITPAVDLAGHALTATIAWDVPMLPVLSALGFEDTDAVLLEGGAAFQRDDALVLEGDTSLLLPRLGRAVLRVAHSEGATLRFRARAVYGPGFGSAEPLRVRTHRASDDHVELFELSVGGTALTGTGHGEWVQASESATLSVALPAAQTNTWVEFDFGDVVCPGFRRANMALVLDDLQVQ